MIKTALSDSVEIMSTYVAFLRALYRIHQDAHWKAQGESYYANHLLFQRIYEATSDSVDEAAEKCLGIFDELDSKEELQSSIVQSFEKRYENLLERSLMAEEAFLKLSEKTYETLKKNDVMTLGLDDMIMAIANNHEVHVYLLKRALK